MTDARAHIADIAVPTIATRLVPVLGILLLMAGFLLLLCLLVRPRVGLSFTTEDLPLPKLSIHPWSPEEAFSTAPQ